MSSVLPAFTLAPTPTPAATEDPATFEVMNRDARSRALLLADHAGRAIPNRLGELGLEAEALERHIAYDIGIDRLTRRLSAVLDAQAILHRYSRLLIDPNRPLDDPTSICAISDGCIVPGNRDLDDTARTGRADAYFHPYHDAIDAIVRAQLDRGDIPALISLHSFTPSFRGHRRPWHIGVLWADDGRMAVPLMDKLSADPTLCIGDNEPYSGKTRHGFTLETHAMDRGLPNVLIEVRQDLIATDADADAWAERLSVPLAEILADERLYRKAPGL